MYRYIYIDIHRYRRLPLPQVRKESSALQVNPKGPPRSAGTGRPSSNSSMRAKKNARKPPNSADHEREARLAFSAKKQLDYYSKEHEQLRRQVLYHYM